MYIAQKVFNVYNILFCRQQDQRLLQRRTVEKEERTSSEIELSNS